jgi:hypothetical protein
MRSFQSVFGARSSGSPTQNEEKGNEKQNAVQKREGV